MRVKGNFKELIKILQEDIDFYKNAMTSGQAKPDRFASLKRVIFSSYLDIAQAQYSEGLPREEIKETILHCIVAFEDSFRYEKGFGQYDEMIWLISLSILSNIDEQSFKRITAVLKRDSVNDKLLSALIRYKDIEWEMSSANVLQQHPYAKTEGIQTAQDIKNYLDRYWYQGHSDAAWHDTHLNKKVNCYAGYWAWEAAALVKVLNIDDSKLKNQKYYPYDAVHW